MTDDQRSEIREAIRRFTAANTASPEAARDALVRMGIKNEDGSFTAPYVGLRGGLLDKT